MVPGGRVSCERWFCAEEGEGETRGGTQDPRNEEFLSLAKSAGEDDFLGCVLAGFQKKNNQVRETVIFAVFFRFKSFAPEKLLSGVWGPTQLPLLPADSTLCRGGGAHSHQPSACSNSHLKAIPRWKCFWL